MTDIRSSFNHQSTMIGATVALMSQISINVGAGFAKHLFPVVGAYGVTSLRVALAAFMLMVFYRPWRRTVPSVAIPALLIYGTMLGMMNLTYYQAIARIPIGIATGIEVMGPLVVVLLASRRIRDLLWLVLAVLGLLCLLPLHAKNMLDPIGMAFALGAAACWVFYIIYGKRLSGSLGSDAAPWGMLVAAMLTLPTGLETTGLLLLSPSTLLAGAGIALLSSAIPYSLEMAAMRRLPAHVFGMLLSASPAVGALVGYIILGEVLTSVQWLAITCIIAAAIGSLNSS